MLFNLFCALTQIYEVCDERPTADPTSSQDPVHPIPTYLISSFLFTTPLCGSTLSMASVRSFRVRQWEDTMQNYIKSGFDKVLLGWHQVLSCTGSERLQWFPLQHTLWPHCGWDPQVYVTVISSLTQWSDTQSKLISTSTYNWQVLSQQDLASKYLLSVTIMQYLRMKVQS